MMDIPTSAITGALRIGLQVVSSHRGPVLEVLHELRNVFGPPHEYMIPLGLSAERTQTQTTRYQDVFVEFVLANLGGVRAENVVLSMMGEFQRNRPGTKLADLEIFNVLIPQLAPGQALFLFRLDMHDFYRYPKSGGEPREMKDETFTIQASYDGPTRGLNRLLRLVRSARGKSQYMMTYTFQPRILRTDFPAPEYNG